MSEAASSGSAGQAAGYDIIALPRATVDDLYEKLKRLDVLERRERLRIVRRSSRSATQRPLIR